MVGVNNTCINWAYPAACQNTTGIQDAISSGDPLAFTSGSTASDTIKDLLTSEILPLTDFETIQSPLAGGIVNFDLESIFIPGAFGNCASSSIGTSCNPGGGSPFDLLQDTANEVTVTFSVSMDAYTGSIATGFTPYVGIFSTNLSGNIPGTSLPFTVPNILTFIAGGGTITSTWSAQESATVPEPSTMVLLGAGLLFVGSATRLRRRR
jgi:hypothetical protein